MKNGLSTHSWGMKITRFKVIKKKTIKKEKNVKNIKVTFLWIMSKKDYKDIILIKNNKKY